MTQFCTLCDGSVVSISISAEMHNAREGRESFEDSFRETAERTNGPQQLVNPKTADGCSVKTKTADMPGK